MHSSNYFAVCTAVFVVAVAVATTSSVSAYSHWTLSGSGFHRTATYEADFNTSLLQPKDFIVTSSAADKNNQISVTLSVPSDFYIDVNELWKRAIFCVIDECDGGYTFQRFPSERWRFVGSSSSHPIDIEGPSFRASTVPKLTEVTMTFELRFSKREGSAASEAERALQAATPADVAARKAAGLLSLEAMQPRVEAGLASHVCNEGKSRIKLSLSFPVHARYAPPVGKVPPSHSPRDAFSVLNVALLLDQMFGQTLQNHQRLSFGEGMRVVRIEHHHHSHPQQQLRNDAVLPQPVKSAQRHEIQGREPVIWSMPVANARVAHLVYWLTTAVVVLGAISVMLAALL